MTLDFPHLITWDSWRLGFGVYYSPPIKDEDADRERYFDGEIGIDLFIGPFTVGVNLLWEKQVSEDV